MYPVADPVYRQTERHMVPSYTKIRVIPDLHSPTPSFIQDPFELFPYTTPEGVGTPPIPDEDAAFMARIEDRSDRGLGIRAHRICPPGVIVTLESAIERTRALIIRCDNSPNEYYPRWRIGMFIPYNYKKFIDSIFYK